MVLAAGADSNLQKLSFGLPPVPVVFEPPPRIDPHVSVAAFSAPPRVVSAGMLAGRSPA
jgi:hypothetical protein